VTHLPAYLLAILAGTLATTGALFILKRPVAVPDQLPVAHSGAVAA
jgi:hypothetical protein